jgi:uncharacterized protein (TIGR02186 family)
MKRCDKTMLAAVVIGVAAFGAAASLRAAEPHSRTGAAPDTDINGAATFTVQPQQVSIGLFYAGTTIRVTADLPADRSYAVLLEGQRESLTVKRKGKVWGLFWMNVGEIEFAEVPTVYLLQTSAPLSSLASAEQLAEEGLGYPALVRRAGADTAAFRELIHLKEKEGFFSITTDAIELESTGRGTARLSASLPLPARIPAGDYAVNLIGFDGGRVRCLEQVPVHLEQAGLARTLHSLAMEQGLLYGCTAVIIAVLAGLGTGLIFGKGTSKGH